MRGFLLTILAAAALLAAGERPRLMGLKRMAVVVTADSSGDLDGRRLQSAVEGKLREAGIQVDPKSRSHLDIVIGVSEIRTAKGEEMGYAYSIHLGVRQQVYLAHNPNVMTDAVTWEGMWLGIASKGDLGSKCAQSLARRVDEFVAVYQAGLEEDRPGAPATARR